jgi:hypothetical protein
MRNREREAMEERQKLLNKSERGKRLLKEMKDGEMRVEAASQIEARNPRRLSRKIKKPVQIDGLEITL